jgi:hypothetical protein
MIRFAVKGISQKVLGHWCYPESREAHALDVIKLLRAQPTNLLKPYLGIVWLRSLTWLIIPCQLPPQYTYCMRQQ